MASVGESKLKRLEPGCGNEKTSKNQDFLIPVSAGGGDLHSAEKAISELPKPLVNYFSFLSNHMLVDSLETATLYQVHEDLRLIRGWSQLRVVQGQGLRWHLLGVAAPGFDSVFPDATAETEDRTQAVVPISADETLSPRILAELCNSIRHPVTGSHFRCITVAIVDSDSTTAYYRIFERFAEIVHPQWKQKKTRSLSGVAAPGASANDCDEDVMLARGEDSSSGSGSSSDSDSED